MSALVGQGIPTPPLPATDAAQSSRHTPYAVRGPVLAAPAGLPPIDLLPPTKRGEKGRLFERVKNGLTGFLHGNPQVHSVWVRGRVILPLAETQGLGIIEV